MFGSVVLDVAIGLSLLFLFVSLIAAAIREAIEMLLNGRAAELERGVRGLLDDPDGTGRAALLYAHPLVCPLAEAAYAPQNLRRVRAIGGRATLRLPVRDRAGMPAYIPARCFAWALLDITVRGGQAGSSPPPITVQTLSTQVLALPEDRVRRALLAAIDEAEGDLDRLVQAVEAWFDNAMRRVGGWYKRRTQVILFAIGLCIAAGMNIDAFSVGKALFEDKALRDGAVAQAAALVPQQPGQDPRQAQETGFLALQAELAGIRFPTGWGTPPPQILRRPGAGGRPGPIDPGAVLQMLVGWLVTAFAVMLGAPFWFDMLNRFMVARSTIKPGARTLSG